jgi:hypothetical protein
LISADGSTLPTFEHAANKAQAEAAMAKRYDFMVEVSAMLLISATHF